MIFAVVAIIFSFLLPKFFNKNVKDSPQGLDIYLGQKYHIHGSGEEMKIFLDGVPYKAIAKEELQHGDFVEVVARKGSVFEVEKI